MAESQFIEYVQERIAPFDLTDSGLAKLRSLKNRFPEAVLMESADIGVDKYLKYGQDGRLTQESVQAFIDHVGGIAYNKSQTPTEQKISHIKHISKNRLSYFNEYYAERKLRDLVYAIKRAGYTDDELFVFLADTVEPFVRVCYSWMVWQDQMDEWTVEFQEEEEAQPKKPLIDRSKRAATANDREAEIRADERSKIVEELTQIGAPYAIISAIQKSGAQ